MDNLPKPITELPHHVERPLVLPDLSEIRRPEPEPGPAAKLLTRIGHEWNREKAEKQDQRHTVVLLVYVPKGTTIIVDQLRTTDGQVVEIEGTNVETGKPETATVDALSFQYEFWTVEHPPDLRLVE